ncbi:MAG TPA: universal stress protein [Acidimicrobiia bacterium]|nr:universal stress protein [Acidimicrobiia bacterium]
MSAYAKILVGVHGSPTSEVAEETAARLAAQLGAELTLIHVSDDEATTQGSGAEILAAAVERARAHGIEPGSELRSGEVAPTIMAAAAELRSDLLVIGDHGMESASPFTLGGIPGQVAHHTPVDILVVRTGRPGTGPHTYGRVLIGTDGSLTAHQATRHGHALAQSLGADVGLIFVGDPLIGDIVLRDTAARLGGDEIEQIVVKGNPAAQISKAATDFDLVVVGNKGMTGSRRYIQRVVPNRVAHDAPTDVLIAKTVGRAFFDLRPGEGAVVEVAGEKVAAYLHDDGTTFMLSARCQHMGCIVGWNGRARTWDCPCHGSRYEYDGALINGPATRPLPPVQT